MSTTFGRFFQKIVNFFNTLESLYTMAATHDVNRVWIEEPNCSEAGIPAVSEKTGVPACATFDWLIPVMLYTEYFATACVERFLCFICLLHVTHDDSWHIAKYTYLILLSLCPKLEYFPFLQ